MINLPEWVSNVVMAALGAVAGVIFAVYGVLDVTGQIPVVKEIGRKPGEGFLRWQMRKSDVESERMLQMPYATPLGIAVLILALLMVFVVGYGPIEWQWLPFLAGGGGGALIMFLVFVVSRSRPGRAL